MSRKAFDIKGELSPFPSWSTGTPVAPLASDEIHVWLASLRQPTERLADFVAILTMDERERAARFRFPEHRDRFIVARGLLRQLLGIYLDRPAAALRFEQGPHGKPIVAGADTGAGLHFNLSHSGEGVVYAIARREVGVDVECLDRTLNFAGILDRMCTPRELARFQTQPPGWEREAFFTCWTRKEAIAKALGGGLASGLRKLEVCFPEGTQPGNRVCLRDTSGREWSVLSLPLGSGWSGALAALGTDWGWRGWRIREQTVTPGFDVGLGG